MFVFRLLSRFHIKTPVALIADMVCIFAADYISFYTFKELTPSDYFTFVKFFGLSASVYGLVFVLSGLYLQIWRYATEIDFLSTIGANLTAGFITTLIFTFMQNLADAFRISFLAMSVTLFFVGGSRLLIRLWPAISFRIAQKFKKSSAKPLESVLIYGAGSAGSLLAKEIIYGKQKMYKITGFIDDDVKKKNLQICGRPILGDKNTLSEILRKYHADKILICIPSLARTELRELVDTLSEYQLPIFILPSMEVLSLDDLLSQVRKVQVDDLLGREKMTVDVSIVGEYIRNRVILITGAGGSIGREVSRQVADLEPEKLILLGRGENSIFEIQQELNVRNPKVNTEYVIADIREYDDMFLVFQKYRPDTVFHAAAHKHVPLMEMNPGAAFVNNVIGTKSLILLAQQFDVERFVFISTDKAIYPTNVMGASKRIAEMYLQSLAKSGCRTKIVIVRFGNVLGSRNSVVQLFNQQIAAGGPVKITDERMTRYFMTIPEASRLVIESGAIGMSGHVYLLKMGESVRIIDLAERMIRLSGLRPGVDMEVKVMGIRPGEKLFEELMSKFETVVESGREGILRVVGPTMSLSQLNEHLTQMWGLYRKNRTVELGELMKSVAWWNPNQQKQSQGEAETASGNVISLASLGP